MHLVSPEELSGLITARLKQQPTVLVALDGRCGSGKTTLAAQLAERFPQSITLHTDDFYLPPPQRVTGWERIPCANMHLERLRAEAVAPARAGRAVCYKAYSCREGAYLPPRVLGPAPLVIVEGSYSHHPSLAPYYDIKSIRHLLGGRTGAAASCPGGEAVSEFRAAVDPAGRGIFYGLCH